MDEIGSWTVKISEERPEFIEVTLSEVGEEGVFAHSFYLEPEQAVKLAGALFALAGHICIERKQNGNSR